LGGTDWPALFAGGFDPVELIFWVVSVVVVPVGEVTVSFFSTFASSPHPANPVIKQNEAARTATIDF
jgi:hypothetical protein